MAMLTDILFKAATYVVAISILVAIHEFGHFWVARKLGIKVLRFSIGFGRVVWSRHGKDGVEYAISAIPLGGYVRMLDERDTQYPVAERDRPFAFNRAPVWKRISVMLAGPGFNFIFAFFAYWVLAVVGETGLRPVVGEVQPQSLAAAAGLRSEDTIRRVGQVEVKTQADTMMAILDQVVGDGIVELEVADRDGSIRTARLEAAGRSRELTEPNALPAGLGFEFVAPIASTVVANLAKDMPAAKAGIQPGDRVVEIDGYAVSSADELTKLIQQRPGKTVQIELQRGTERVDLTVPVAAVQVEEAGATQTVGRIGVVFDRQWPEHMKVAQRLGPIDGLGKAAVETWSKTQFTVEIIWRLITGKVSLKSISGPIGIADVAGTVVKHGFVAFLTLLAIISISVGVLNLLPVPLLDGGQIVYQLAELLKGAPVSERAQVLGQQVGIVLLALLMGLALFNDLAPRLG